VAVSVFKIDAGPPRAWVGSTPMHSRHTPLMSSRASRGICTWFRLDFRVTHPLVMLSKIPVRLLLIATTVIAISGVAVAQDTVTVPRPVADSLRPPISPKRAFLNSLALPGSAQNRLGRHRVAVGIIAVEAMSIAMIRESGADVREARRQLGDSLVISYVDATGTRLATPTTERRRFGEDEVSARRSHIEDWVALLIANHLFAAADAFVSASLWDVNARVTLGGSRNNLLVGARLEW
jgi:hypothetical protein